MTSFGIFFDLVLSFESDENVLSFEVRVHNIIFW